MNLYLVLNIITVLEIVCTEFIVIWILSLRKYSFIKSLALYLLFTIPVLLFMCFIAVKTPNYGDGSGRFMVMGAVYFIPALISYGGDWKSRLIIAFYSFSYGLAGFALSVRVGYLFRQEVLDVVVLITQTLLYLLTLPFFLNFSKRWVIRYIQKANSSQKNLLIRHTIVSFILIISYNKNMVEEGSAIRKLLIYLLLIYFIIITYKLVVSYLKADDNVQELNELANLDRLTGLGNRQALRKKLEDKIQAGNEFGILFLDLDNFKSVNDQFGHHVGDVCLQSFACTLKDVVGDASECFRLAGDEFICLTQDCQLQSKLREMSVTYPVGGIEQKAQSFSLGAAWYPKDAKTAHDLLELADKHMYEEKWTKR